MSSPTENRNKEKKSNVWEVGEAGREMSLVWDIITWRHLQVSRKVIDQLARTTDLQLKGNKTYMPLAKLTALS